MDGLKLLNQRIINDIQGLFLVRGDQHAFPEKVGLVDQCCNRMRLPRARRSIHHNDPVGGIFRGEENAFLRFIEGKRDL